MKYEEPTFLMIYLGEESVFTLGGSDDEPYIDWEEEPLTVNNV